MSQAQLDMPWKLNPEDNEDVAWALSTAEALLGRGERQEAVRWVRRAAEQAADAGEDDRALELAKSAAELASESRLLAAVPVPLAAPANEAPAPLQDPSALGTSQEPPATSSWQDGAAPEIAKPVVAAPPTEAPIAAPPEVANGSPIAATLSAEVAPPTPFSEPAEDEWSTDAAPAPVPAETRIESIQLPEGRPSASRPDMMAGMFLAARRSDPPGAAVEPTPVVPVTSELPAVPPSTAPRAEAASGLSLRPGVTQAVRVFVTLQADSVTTVTLADSGAPPAGSFEALLVALATDTDLVSALRPK